MAIIKYLYLFVFILLLSAQISLGQATWDARKINSSGDLITVFLHLTIKDGLPVMKVIWLIRLTAAETGFNILFRLRKISTRFIFAMMITAI